MIKVDETNNEYFPVVTITFKDRTMLNYCVIFDEEPSKGTEGLKYQDEIELKFKKLPWYSRFDGWVYFQSRYINGCFHVENVDEYKVYFVSKEEFKGEK